MRDDRWTSMRRGFDYSMGWWAAGLVRRIIRWVVIFFCLLLLAQCATYYARNNPPASRPAAGAPAKAQQGQGKAVKPAVGQSGQTGTTR